MIVRGYTRILSRQQDLLFESEILQRAGASEVFTERSPAGNVRRVVLDNIVGLCAAGDLIVVLSLNRLGRSIDEILSTVAMFDKKMTYILSLNDGFDSRTDENGVLGSLFDALKSAKADLSSELTQRGMATYASSGKKIGRPSVDKKLLREALDMIFSGLPVGTVAQSTRISAPTLHRYLAKERVSRPA